MKKVLASLLVLLLSTVTVGAAELELAGYAGYTFPRYDQTFLYDSGPIDIPIPGVAVDQSGTFLLKATGGLLLAGGLTLYATDRFGFEFRLDSAGMGVETQSNTYSVQVDLPQPLDPVAADLELDKAEADLGALTPWSLNVKVRSGGESLRFTVSGGLSRLGNVDFTINQQVSLGVVAVNLETNELEIATVNLRGSSDVESESSWGGNLGLGIQIGLGERGALVLEGRGFYFPERTFTWEHVEEVSLPPLQEVLLERVLERLDPIEFRPWWFQATVGVAIRF